MSVNGPLGSLKKRECERQNDIVLVFVTFTSWSVWTDPKTFFLTTQNVKF